MNRKVVLATIGTLGDLHPFIALALALRARGERPVIASAAEYRLKVEAAGIPFHALRPSYADVQRDLGMDRAELTRRTLAQGRFLFRKLLFADLRATYDDMMTVSADADLIVTSTLAFAARLAAEKRGLPWIAVVLQPMLFVSAHDPPIIPRVEWLAAVMRRLGPIPSTYLLRFVKAAVGTLFGPVHRLRAQIGLPATRLNPMADGQFSAAGAIALYSSVLGPVQPDYPADTAVVGFAFYDSVDGAAPRLDAALAAFLDRGEPPLVFTLGSLIVNSPGAFFRESLTAARRLKMRAVLLVGDGKPVPLAATAPDAGDGGVIVCEYAPHSLLFPRAAVIVHQGGVGTLGQALRSGRPQLVVPHYADQMDNAARAERLGVARVVAPGDYDAETAAAALRALLEAGHFTQCAQRIRAVVIAEDGANAAAASVQRRLAEIAEPERLG